MSMSKRFVQTVGLATGVVAIVAAATPETSIGRSARKLARRLERRGRYVVGMMPGVAYRLAGRRPNPDVSDDILADRIRSAIGPVEKSLDVPRVHVMVEDHVAIVHGDIPEPSDAHAITHAIMQVSGVRGVESHLHAGLIDGDTRPSESSWAGQPASNALKTLVAAAEHSGAHRPYEAIHAVLCGFADRLPDDEREHFFSHLPADVRALAGPPHRHGEKPRVRTLEQLVATAMAEGGVDPDRATEITTAILRTLRELVPEEAGDVAAVLPSELRVVWDRTISNGTTR